LLKGGDRERGHPVKGCIVRKKENWIFEDILRGEKTKADKTCRTRKEGEVPCQRKVAASAKDVKGREVIKVKAGLTTTLHGSRR